MGVTNVELSVITKMIKRLQKPYYLWVALSAVFAWSNFYAQQASVTLDTAKAANNCETAKKIIINGPKTITYKSAPMGGGINEIKINNFNKGYAFEKEHNSSWHQLVFNVEGNLCFTIKPLKKEDDYDFMLFLKTDSNTCQTIQRLKPLRANISRDKEELEGLTGLKATASSELVKQGVNDAYSKSIAVSKGEVYLLAIDNVYEQGEGFVLDLFFERALVLKGQLTNENNQPIKGEIKITNAGGKEIANAQTDSVTGAFKLNALLRERTKYTINYYSDGHFFFTQQFTTTDSIANKPITRQLATIKKGSKQSIGAINFLPDQDVYIKAAEPALKNLLRILKKESQLIIKIIGHTNGCGLSNYRGGIKGLSLGRAESIRKYLEENGIKTKTRVYTEGKDCQEMLYPESGVWWQQEANRRVEIEILEN